MSSAVTVRRCKYGWRVYAGGRRLRKVRPCYSRDVYVGEGLAVKLEPWEHARQNRREAEALEDQEIRAAAAESGVILPELVEVGPDHQWIAVTHLALHRPRSARRREMYARVRRVMKVAQRCDHQEEYWNWAMVGDQPAIYDLGV